MTPLALALHGDHLICERFEGFRDHGPRFFQSRRRNGELSDDNLMDALGSGDLGVAGKGKMDDIAGSEHVRNSFGKNLCNGKGFVNVVRCSHLCRAPAPLSAKGTVNHKRSESDIKISRRGEKSILRRVMSHCRTIMMQSFHNPRHHSNNNQNRSAGQHSLSNSVQMISGGQL